MAAALDRSWQRAAGWMAEDRLVWSEVCERQRRSAAHAAHGRAECVEGHCRVLSPTPSLCRHQTGIMQAPAGFPQRSLAEHQHPNTYRDRATSNCANERPDILAAYGAGSLKGVMGKGVVLNVSKRGLGNARTDEAENL